MHYPNPPFTKAGVHKYVPFVKEPTARWEAPSTSDLTMNSLQATSDVMFCITRQVDYVVTKQAIRRAGADYGKILYNNVADYVAKQYELTLIDILKAIFGYDGTNTAGVCFATHTLETNTPIDNDVIFAAKTKLGDKGKYLGTIIMHSAQFNNLVQSGLIKYYNASELGYDIWTKGTIPTINGLWIIQTDTVPVETTPSGKLYHAYIGAAGSIEFRNIQFNNKPHWDALAGGTDYFIQTSKIMLRVPGVKYLRQNASDTMNFTDADIANPACWSKVAEDNKDIPLIEVITTAKDIYAPEPEPEE